MGIEPCERSYLGPVVAIRVLIHDGGYKTNSAPNESKTFNFSVTAQYFGSKYPNMTCNTYLQITYL